MMKRGEVHAMMPLFKTPDRETFMHFYDENLLAYEENVFFVLKGEDIRYSGIQKRIRESSGSSA